MTQGRLPIGKQGGFPAGEAHPKWKGGRRKVLGYWVIHMPEHPKASIGGKYVLEHVLVCEKALGRHYSAAHPVHHVNEKRDDNRGRNLVLCEDHAYHMLLHQRQRAKDACGNADWIACTICGTHGDPSTMQSYYSGRAKRRLYQHGQCNRDKVNEQSRRKREARASNAR